MAGSSRKGKKKAVSYAEVDSDVDMQEEDRQVEQIKVQSRKKARKTKEVVKKVTSALPVESTLDGFIEMPLDILAEVCSHLDPCDLVRLSRTTKLFRSLLLSKSSKHIWLASRRSANLPELPGLDEIRYAQLTVDKWCMTCGCEHYTVEADYILYHRNCRACRKTLLLTESTESFKKYKLHPSTLSCLPTSKIGFKRRGWSYFGHYLKSELFDVSATLFQLEEDDEIAMYAWQSTAQSGGTRSRKKEAAPPPESSVQAFVKEKAAERKLRMDRGALVVEQLSTNRQAEGLRVRNEQAARERGLKLDLEIAEWLDDDITWYLQNVYVPVYDPYAFNGSAELQHLVRPLHSCPSTEPEAWAIIKSEVEDRREQEEREAKAISDALAAQQREDGRFNAIRLRYDALLDEQAEGEDTLTFPRVNTFAQLESIQSLWTGNETTLDDTTWEAALDSIKTDLATHRSQLRVKAIRTILAANRDVRIETLSTNPADYPENEYDETFFAKPTSLFFNIAEGVCATYPSCLDFDSWSSNELDLTEYLDRRHSLVVRAIVEVGELDEATATADDINELGCSLRWTNAPEEAQRGKFTAGALLITVLNNVRKTKTKRLPRLIIERDTSAMATANDDDSNDAAGSTPAPNSPRKDRTVVKSDEDEPMIKLDSDTC